MNVDLLFVDQDKFNILAYVLNTSIPLNIG